MMTPAERDDLLSTVRRTVKESVGEVFADMMDMPASESHRARGMMRDTVMWVADQRRRRNEMWSASIAEVVKTVFVILLGAAGMFLGISWNNGKWHP